MQYTHVDGTVQTLPDFPSRAGEKNVYELSANGSVWKGNQNFRLGKCYPQLLGDAIYYTTKDDAGVRTVVACSRKIVLENKLGAGVALPAPDQPIKIRVHAGTLTAATRVLEGAFLNADGTVQTLPDFPLNAGEKNVYRLSADGSVWKGNQNFTLGKCYPQPLEDAIYYTTKDGAGVQTVVACSRKIVLENKLGAGATLPAPDQPIKISVGSGTLLEASMLHDANENAFRHPAGNKGGRVSPDQGYEVLHTSGHIFDLYGSVLTPPTLASRDAGNSSVTLIGSHSMGSSSIKPTFEEAFAILNRIYTVPIISEEYKYQNARLRAMWQHHEKNVIDELKCLETFLETSQVKHHRDLFNILQNARPHATRRRLDPSAMGSTRRLKTQVRRPSWSGTSETSSEAELSPAPEPAVLERMQELLEKNSNPSVSWEEQNLAAADLRELFVTNARTYVKHDYAATAALAQNPSLRDAVESVYTFPLPMGRASFAPLDVAAARPSSAQPIELEDFNPDGDLDEEWASMDFNPELRSAINEALNLPASPQHLNAPSTAAPSGGHIYDGWPGPHPSGSRKQRGGGGGGNRDGSPDPVRDLDDDVIMRDAPPRRGFSRGGVGSPNGSPGWGR
jgi:hypothetical protein